MYPGDTFALHISSEECHYQSFLLRLDILELLYNKMQRFGDKWCFDAVKSILVSFSMLRTLLICWRRFFFLILQVTIIFLRPEILTKNNIIFSKEKVCYLIAVLTKVFFLRFVFCIIISCQNHL